MSQLDFSTILASTVHDMKNSIGMLMHQINQLQMDSPPEPADLGQLQFEAARLNNYLIQLMTLYKVDNQQYQFQADECYLDEFVEDAVLMNQPILQPWGITIEQLVDAELCWNFDKNLVVGVLGNIVTNVIRYAKAKVRICASGSNGELCLRIEDDGPGYPEAMLGQLEKREMGVDYISGSTGFGLYFSVLVAEQHSAADDPTRQGRVVLSNGGELGGGCFELYLP
ncbi:MAG: HAMP domain-containing sensor histidine kinase [Motiliproteus sp.]